MIETMQPISEKYTKETFQQGDWVKAVLKENLEPSYSTNFDYQGSITSDTHIQVHSDTDLLLIHGRFISNDLGVPDDSLSRAA